MSGYVLLVVIEKASVRAQVVGRGPGFVGEERESRVFEAPMPSVKGSLKDSMGALLEDMEREGFSDFKRVLLGLSGHLVSLRVLTLPFTDARKAEEVLALELVDSLVEDPDDLVFGALILEGARTLAVTIEKKVLENILESFEKLGLTPEWLGLPLLYKDKLLKNLHKDISVAAFVDATSIIVLKNNNAYHYAYINDPVDLKFALATLEGEGTVVEHFYLTDKTADWLKGTLQAGSPGTQSVHTTNYRDEDTGLSAMAMYVADGPGSADKGTTNFRKGEFIDRRVYESAKRSFRVAITLIIIVACLWGVNIYTRLQSPKREIARVEGALYSAFDELFPNDAVVDPLYQMEVKLKGLREERKFVEGGLDVLERLKGLSRGIPDNDGQTGPGEVRLFELKMHETRVIARGETASFDHADRFKDALQALPEYKDISLTDVKSKVDGSVSFSIALTLKGEG
jgi:hypothetical protein